MSELIVDKIQSYLEGYLPTLELTLFDIQFRREGHGWVLRVFIDGESGITLDQCSEVSREVGQYLDVEDLIDHAYSLEVSSPGLERPLRSCDDFKRFCGSRAKIRFHDNRDGEKIFQGTIQRVEGEKIVFELIDGGSIEFSFDMLNKARLAV